MQDRLGLKWPSLWDSRQNKRNIYQSFPTLLLQETVEQFNIHLQLTYAQIILNNEWSYLSFTNFYLPLSETILHSITVAYPSN